jgi:endonuclease YncB( thermonuclease family)
MKKTSVALFLITSLGFLSCSSVKKYMTKSNICEHTNDNFKCVKYISAYDGDTITVDIPNVPPYFGYHAKVRIKGIDTPEITSKNTCERKIAEEAKNKTTILLITAKKIDLLNIAKEKYGRILADVIADGNSIGLLLLKEKLAYEYKGDTKQKINWCNFKK